jgi:hypothetical protein
MKSLGMLQNIHRQSDLLAFELRIDALEGILHTEPEIDFLRCCTGRDIPWKLGDCLNLFDPRVDVGLKFVEEERVGKEGLWFDSIDRDSVPAGMALVVSCNIDLMLSTDLGDCLSDSWVHR